MDKVFDNKINILKALAIMLVVSWHLEFSLIPMFPPYSFQVVLFFFIAGMLYKNEYSLSEYIVKKFKTLLFPYAWYCIFYLILTVMMAPIIGKFWAMPISFKNEFIMPFLTGHQIDLISPMWFVPQLFCSLITYKFFRMINLTNCVRFIILTFFVFFAIYLAMFRDNVYVLFFLRTLFSLFFIHLGYFYQNKIRSKYDIFGMNIVYSVLILQSILWLTNKDYTPLDGIGLSYILVWGEFDSLLIPILTSISGIYISLFIVEVLYERVKNSVWLNKIGRNTYHIMANHLFVFNLITYLILYVKKIPFEVKNSADIYWFYNPLKTTYIYFFTGLVVSVLIGDTVKFIKNKLLK